MPTFNFFTIEKFTMNKITRNIHIYANKFNTCSNQKVTSGLTVR